MKQRLSEQQPLYKIKRNKIGRRFNFKNAISYENHIFIYDYSFECSVWFLYKDKDKQKNEVWHVYRCNRCKQKGERLGKEAFIKCNSLNCNEELLEQLLA